MLSFRGGLVCLVVLAVSSFGLCSVAFAAELGVATGGGGGSSLESSLVAPEVSGLTGGQGALDAEEVRLSSPEGVVAREESQAKYEGLSGGEAMALAGKAFPGVISVPAGGPPVLATGQRITGFVNANVAKAELGGGEYGLVTSLAPMAVASSGGGWSPVDLGLSESDGAFVAANPLIGIRIPRRIGDGVQIAGQELALTPVDGQGQALGGSEGVIDGAAVFYANTLVDTDTLVKPTTLGFEVDALLRSQASPEQLMYKVALPTGASLSQEEGTGAVLVVKEGATLARIASPMAHDATGTTVPVSVSTSGNTLTLNVHDEEGKYQYPIEVDPEFNWHSESLAVENWHFDNTGHGFIDEKSKTYSTVGSVMKVAFLLVTGNLFGRARQAIRGSIR